jgi:hypothetical protein
MTSFEYNGYIAKIVEFTKNNILIVDLHDKNNKFVKKDRLSMGQIPKKIKKSLKPLK